MRTVLRRLPPSYAPRRLPGADQEQRMKPQVADTLSSINRLNLAITVWITLQFSALLMQLGAS